MRKEGVGSMYFTSFDGSHTWEMASGTSLFELYDGTAGIDCKTTAWKPAPMQWHYISAERSGDTLILYGAGVSRASLDITGKTINWNDTVGGKLGLGGCPGVAFSNAYFDEIAIHKGIARHGGAATYAVPTGPYCD